MKSKLTLIALFTLSLTFAQDKPGSKDYFNRYYPKNLVGSHLETIWLNANEISLIIYEEMKNAGYEMLSTSLIIKLDSGKYVVPVCYSEKSRFGFLLEEAHGNFPNESNRNVKSLYKVQTGYDYAQKIAPISENSGNYEIIKVKTVPENLYILKADCYCYQQTDNPKDNSKLVTKAFIINVLRQDIRSILKKYLQR